MARCTNEECYVPIWTRFTKLDDSETYIDYPIDVHLHHTYCHATWDDPADSELETVGIYYERDYIKDMFNKGYVFEWRYTEDEDSDIIAVITDWEQFVDYEAQFEEHAHEVCDQYTWHSTDDYFDYDGGEDYDY